MIQARRDRWAGYVACIGETRDAPIIENGKFE
jgi:hypothetical protein